MTNAERRSEERRAQARREVELPVLVTDIGNRVAAQIRFEVRDMSLGGAFVRSPLLFEVGEELDMEFQIPDGPLVRARGRVVRVERAAGLAEAGMGIAFSHLSESDQAALRAYLALD